MTTDETIFRAWFQHQNLSNPRLESIQGNLWSCNSKRKPVLLGFYRNEEDTFYIYNLGSSKITYQINTTTIYRIVYGEPVYSLNFDRYFKLIGEIANDLKVKILYIPTPSQEFITAAANKDFQTIETFFNNPKKLSSTDIKYLLFEANEDLYKIFINWQPNINSQITLNINTILTGALIEGIPIAKIERVIDTFARQYPLDIPCEVLYLNYSHCSYRNIETTTKYLNLFLSKYIDPNKLISDKHTILTEYLSTAKHIREDEYIPIMNSMISNGCDPYVILPRDSSLFWFKLIDGNRLLDYQLDIVYKIFKDNNIDINKTDEWNRNILHIVAKKNSYKVIDIFNQLVELGVDPDHQAIIDDQDKVTLAKIKGTLPPEYGKTPRELLEEKGLQGKK